jgi:hypothetical protein
MKKCPGSMSFTQPKPEVVKCADCGADVEIWSDEATGTCLSCSKTVIRSETQSCVDYCKYAKECLGDDKFKQYGQMKAAMRKPALIAAMANYFGSDRKRIEHARKVVSYAESILAVEKEADPNLVIAAAVLHDIGIKNAEAKHGSSEARYQEEEGPPVARAILTELGYPEGFIVEVCDIVGHHHHPRQEETLHFRILYDADLLVNSEKERMRRGAAGLSEEFLSGFLTRAGREIAIRTAVGRGDEHDKHQ